MAEEAQDADGAITEFGVAECLHFSGSSEQSREALSAAGKRDEARVRLDLSSAEKTEPAKEKP